MSLVISVLGGPRQAMASRTGATRPEASVTVLKVSAAFTVGAVACLVLAGSLGPFGAGTPLGQSLVLAAVIQGGLGWALSVVGLGVLVARPGRGLAFAPALVATMCVLYLLLGVGYGEVAQGWARRALEAFVVFWPPLTGALVVPAHTWRLWRLGPGAGGSSGANPFEDKNGQRAGPSETAPQDPAAQQ
jgi:hypothetical protein